MSRLLVVGSRRCSEYGLAVCRDLVGQLSREGFVIVSSISEGINATALLEATRTGGKAIGVLGYGKGFLRRDKKMRVVVKNMITKGNTVLFPFKKTQYPSKKTFYFINKKMLEMCDGVLVIETAVEGASMWVAHLAEEMGKQVFAVPGSVFSYASQGSNLLIQQGAKIVTGVGSILLPRT